MIYNAKMFEELKGLSYLAISNRCWHANLTTYTGRQRTIQQHSQELRDFVATVLAAADLPTPSKKIAQTGRNPSNSFANTEAHAKKQFPRPKGMDQVIQV